MAKLKTHNLRIITEKYVYLEDGGQGLSITNDAEDVVRRLQLNWQLGSRRIFYKDEHGRIDEIILINDRFSHFQPADNSPFLNEIKSILKQKQGA